MLTRLLRIAACLVFVTCSGAYAQTAEPTPQGELVIPREARPGTGFDVDRATQAYLDSVAPDARRKSDAYFEGRYWLELWTFLYGLGVAALLLFSRISARLRDRAERITRRPWLQTAIYAAGIIVLNTLLVLPLSLYSEWFREHQYGLSNLTLAAWFGEFGKSLVISVVLGTLLLTLIYAAMRRRRGNWWLPATVLTVVFLFFLTFIEPVFLAPVFNEYRPLGPGEVRDSVLSLARANGVSADQVYWFDASKQTNRISANVSGMLGTARISLNDNLLGRTSVPEIKAVMAHELGHFVLNHGVKLTIQFGLVFAVGFAVVQALQGRLLARYGQSWDVRDPVDIAGLPLIVALLSAWFFLMTPVMNGIVRVTEMEADLFGLNAAREPHGFSSAAMRLASYRKLQPTPLEEFIFFDHPSGRTRVQTAMQWFAEHQDASAGAR